MAVTKLVEYNAGLFADGVYHAELELNQVAFPFTGRIEAQTPLTDENNFIGEVGMILVVDKWNQNATTQKTDPVVRPTKAGDDDTALFAINYSTELVYDERYPELRYFKQKRGRVTYDWLGNGTNDDIYPRLGYLSKGDRFTTSAIDLAGSPVTDLTGLDLAAAKTAVEALNGECFVAGTDGYWVYCADTSTAVGPVIRVIDATIGMADGSLGFKVECVKA